MNILYLTDTRFSAAPYRDASTRYRCFHFAEDLREIGHNADVCTIDNLPLERLSNYRVVSVLRPTASRRLTRILEVCRRLDILTIADFDDLLFSPDHAEVAPSVLSRQSAIRPMRRKFQQHLEALRQFQLVTVATEPLKEHVLKMHPGATVTQIPNGLSSYWMRSNLFLDSLKLSNSEGSAAKSAAPLSTITYLPGSRSHNADFNVIIGLLSELLNKHQELSLNIIGELDFDTDAFRPEQLQKAPWMEYMRLPAMTRNSLVTIAPLESSLFNQCKSHIKFIESAAFGTPVIMSSIPDVARHAPVDGLYVVDDPSAWQSAFDQILDKDFNLSCRERLQDYARSNCMNHSSLSNLLGFMTQALSQPSYASTTTHAHAS